MSSSISFFFFFLGPSLAQGWFPLHTLYSGPSYPQLDHSWALLPQLHSLPFPSKGVMWADEIIYVKAFVNCKAQSNANDYCCYYSYHAPGKPCCPPPSQTYAAGQPGTLSEARQPLPRGRRFWRKSVSLASRRGATATLGTPPPTPAPRTSPQ